MKRKLARPLWGARGGGHRRRALLRPGAARARAGADRHGHHRRRDRQLGDSGTLAGTAGQRRRRRQGRATLARHPSPGMEGRHGFLCQQPNSNPPPRSPRPRPTCDSRKTRRSNQIHQAEANLAAAQAQVAAGRGGPGKRQPEFQARPKDSTSKGVDSVQDVRPGAHGLGRRDKPASNRCAKQVQAAQAAVAPGQGQRRASRRPARRPGSHHPSVGCRRGPEGQGRSAPRLHRNPRARSMASSTCAPRSRARSSIAGQAIVTLINPDDLWVRADVEETYIDRIHLGDKLQRPAALRRGAPGHGVLSRRGRRLRHPARRQPHQARHQDLRSPPALRQPRPQPGGGHDRLRDRCAWSAPEPCTPTSKSRT